MWIAKEEGSELDARPNSVNSQPKLASRDRHEMGLESAAGVLAKMEAWIGRLIPKVQARLMLVSVSNLFRLVRALEGPGTKEHIHPSIHPSIQPASQPS